MKTMKTIVATLFIMFAVSMPVHAQYRGFNYVHPDTEWQVSGNIDEMTDEIKSSNFYNQYTGYFHVIQLDIDCDNNISIFSWYNEDVADHSVLLTNRIDFDDRYESDTENFLVRFDNDEVFYIQVGKTKKVDFIMRLPVHFLSKLQNRRILRMKIHMEVGYSIVAKFNITGFTEAFEEYRSQFCD